MLMLLNLLPRLVAVGATALVISGTALTGIDTVSGVVTPGVASPGVFPNDVLWFMNSFFVVNSMSDDVTLQKFDPLDWSYQSLGIGSGLNCWAVLPIGGDTLAVSCALGNSIALVSASDMSLLGFIEGVGPNPEWFCVADGKLYAACGGWLSDNKIVVVDLTTLSPCDTVSVGFNCQGCTFDGVDEVYAICTGSYSEEDGEVHVIDVATGQVTGIIEAGYAPSFGVCRGDSLYVSDYYGQGVMLIDTESGSLVSPSVFPGGTGLAVDSEENLWVASSGANLVKCYDHDHQLLASYYVASPYDMDVSVEQSGVEPQLPTQGTITLSPSPACGIVRVRTSAGVTDSPVLFDLTGRMVHEASFIEAGSWLVDVSRVPQGVYIVVAGRQSSRLAVVR